MVTMHQYTPLAIFVLIGLAVAARLNAGQHIHLHSTWYFNTSQTRKPCALWPMLRVLQMAIVLSLESVEEFLDYWGDDTGHVTWRLTPTEVKAILAQRSDFNKDTISALPL